MLDGVPIRLLRADPGIYCDTAEWYAWSVLAWVSFGLYCLGVPLLMLVLARKYHVLATAKQYSVIADKEDAWNKFKGISIGAVYLRKVDGKVKALHTVCPHLGCFIDYRAGKNDFYWREAL